MVNRLLSLLMMLCCIFMVQAQEPQAPQLPLNPNVKHGTLPNGLNYYIMHNEEPAGRANFYIAQKVGSTLETKDQLGLAHFLEHMAFNGSTNFPGKMMLEYLQNKGIRFGADINAYTGFDETVYRINNVPTSDVALMDTVLLVLHDWSGDLLLEDDEIDAERGVIQEEWRTRNDANTRMFTALLPQLYKEYQYTQMPIGTMDVVMNFPYQVLRDYYHKWYRPDQQGIVIVGDFDAAEMEQKVIKLFSTIKMPENAAERVYPVVSDNDELIYATFQDPELRNMMVQLSIKCEKTPFAQRAGLDYYLEKNIANYLIMHMIDARLAELAKKPDCAFAYAGVTFGDYYVSKTKGAFDIIVIPKTDAKAAFEQALSEVVRACKTGFTDSELSRAKDELKASYEKAYNERNKTNSDALAQEMIRHFIDNEPAPGIEAEWQIVQQLLPMLPVQAFNEAVKDIITPNNQVLIVTMPQAEGNVAPTREEMMQIISTTMNKEYEAFVDDVLDEPLIPKLPKKGKIKSTTEVPQFGATKLVLSNGATVYVKTTDFASDQILFAATANFGKLSYPATEAANLAMFADAFEVSNLGKFSATQLEKALAGKKVASQYSLNNNSSGFSGVTTVKDLESLMQILYLQFTAVSANPEDYAALVNQYTAVLANLENTPDYAFGKLITDTRYNKNPLMAQLNTRMVTEANYDRIIAMARENMSNAADYDFIFVGNVDVETLKPLLEQYIASLPGNPKKAHKRTNAKLELAEGQIETSTDFPMESPQVKEFVLLSGDNVPYTMKNNVMIDFMAKVLDIIYTRTLREEIGGTYGAGVAGWIDPRTGKWMLVYQYETGDETKDALAKRAVSDLQELMANGAPVEDFNKVKEQALNQYSLSIKKNNYWLNMIQTYCLLGIDENTGMEQTIRDLTIEDLNAFMKTLYDGKNRMRVVLNGTKKQ